MVSKVKAGATGKGSNKRSQKPNISGSTAKSKKSSSIKSASKPATQHKPKPASAQLTTKRKQPPHAKYTSNPSLLNLPTLNSIRPSGIQKPPNKKKGKNFVDDGEGMRTILAMVMAEKEGNIESKMMRARQMEEIREARRVEAEKRKEGKQMAIEGRKEEIKQSGKKRKGRSQDQDQNDGVHGGREIGEGSGEMVKKAKKKVSFR